MPATEDRLRELESIAGSIKTQRERDGAAGKSIYDDPGVTTKSAMASLRARAEGGSKEASLQHPEAGSGIDGAVQRFSNYTGDVQRTFADRLTRGGADYALSVMSGNTVEEEAKETTNAAERAGKVGEAFGVVGDLAPAALVPAAAVAGPVSAGLTGAALGATDTTLNSLLREGEAPNLAEIGVSAVLGGGGGVAGHYVGRLLMSEYVKLVGADKPLHQQAQASLKKVIDEQNAAAAQMRNAGVKLNRSSVQGLATRLQRRILTNREFSVAYRLKGHTPLARQALKDINELTRVTGKPSFDDVNEVRKLIRDSVKNAGGEITAGVRDAQIIDFIDTEMKNYLGNMANKPTGHVVSGNVKEAIAGFNEMNRLTQNKYKQNIVAGLLKRAHYSETAGTSYDKAVQQQFKTLVQPSIRGKYSPALNQFSEDEKKLLEEAAEGGLTTKVLNRLDQSFGHGLLSDLHRTYAIGTRKAVKPGAIREAGKVFEGIGGELPKQPVMQQSQGARTGIAAGMETADQLTQSPEPPQQ